MDARTYPEHNVARAVRKTWQAIDRVRRVSPEAARELGAYCEAMETRIRPRTRENYLNQLSRVCRLIGKPLSELCNEDVKRYFREIRAMSGGTKYSSWQSLRSFFCDHLKYHRQMDDQLVSRWERLVDNVPRPSPSKRLLTHNDLITQDVLNRLLVACRNPRDKALVLVLFETGARLGEVLSLSVRDINFSATPIEVKIRHSKTEDREGRRPVYLFRASALLKQWLQVHPLNDGRPSFYTSDAPVWVATQGTPRAIASNTANQVLRFIKTRAGLPVTTPIFAHLFRYSRANDLHQNYGLDVKEVKEVLGHSKIETTDGYLKINRHALVAKLVGEDKPSEEKRREAIRQGLPVTCQCGATNDPQTAFCYQCGTIINKAVTREIIQEKNRAEAGLRERIDTLTEHLVEAKLAEIMAKHGFERAPRKV